MPTPLDKIKRYLNSLRLVHEVHPKRGEITRFIVPFQDDEYKRKFHVVIDHTEQWIRFWTLIASHEDIGDTSEAQMALYRALLEANGQIAELKYFLSEEGDVGIIGHEAVDVLTIDGFRNEFMVIPYGINYFIKEIAAKLKMKIAFPPKEKLSFYR